MSISLTSRGRPVVGPVCRSHRRTVRHRRIVTGGRIGTPMIGTGSGRIGIGTQTPARLLEIGLTIDGQMSGPPVMMAAAAVVQAAVMPQAAAASVAVLRSADRRLLCRRIEAVVVTQAAAAVAAAAR